MENGSQISSADKPTNSAPTHNHWGFHHSAVKWLAIILAELILLIAVFSFGMHIGLRRAQFTYSWIGNYPRNIIGMPGRPPQSGMRFFSANGLTGTILTINNSTLTIKDSDNTEKTVILSATTIIRQNFQDLKPADLKANQQIVVLGEPNPQGQIEAKFIRVLN